MQITLRTVFLFLAVLLTAAAQTSYLSVPVNGGQMMGQGPDGFLYVASFVGNNFGVGNGALSQIDTTTGLPNWKIPFGGQISGMSFHPTLGIILQAVDNSGTPVWMTVPYDGNANNITYHQIGGKNGVGVFGGNGCAVDNRGNIFLASAVTGSYNPFLGGQEIVMVTPPNLDQPLSVPGPSVRIPMGSMVSSRDGKTIAAVSYTDGNSLGSLVIIQNQKVVSFDGMPFLTLPLSSPRPPRFSPDGGTIYLTGFVGCSGCAATWGEMTFDVSHMVLSPLHTTTNEVVLDFAWSATDAYYLLQGSVVPLDASTWKPRGPAFANPDGSGNGLDNPNTNHQLLADRNQFTDTLMALMTNQVLIWDVPRTPVIAAVVNAASYKAETAPGNWAATFGSGMGYQAKEPDPAWQALHQDSPFPTELGAGQMTRAQISCDNGNTWRDMALRYVSPAQVNVLIPADLPTGSCLGRVGITNPDNTWTWSNTSPITLAEYAPGVYATTDGSYQLISANNPATPGKVLIVWAAGLGPTQMGPDGLPHTVTLPTVTVGGIPAEVVYSGSCGYFGLYQVNLVVPDGMANGDQPLVVIQAGQSSPVSTVAVAAARRP